MNVEIDLDGMADQQQADEKKKNSISEQLLNQNFIVTKSVSVPNNDGSGVETALFIEHADNKVFNYMLVVQVPKLEVGKQSLPEPIKTLSEPSAKNKIFKITQIENVIQTPVTITVAPTAAPAPAQPQAQAPAQPQPQAQAPAQPQPQPQAPAQPQPQAQAQAPAQPQPQPQAQAPAQPQAQPQAQAPAPAPTSINVYTVESATIQGIANGKIPKMFVLEVNRQKSGATENALKVVTFGYAQTGFEKQRLTALEDKIYDQLMNLLDASLKSDGIISPDVNKQTLELQKYYNLLTKTINSDKITISADAIVNNITGGKFVYIDDENMRNSLLKEIKEYRDILAVGDKPFQLPHRAIKKGIFKNIYSPDYIKKRDNYVTLYNYFSTLAASWLQNPIREKIKINNESSYQDISNKMNFITEMVAALPREESVFNPVKYGFRYNAANMKDKKGGALTSVVYQKRRYNVHRDEQDRATIHLKKKAYVLKESSKGLYITVDGKREYVH